MDYAHGDVFLEAFIWCGLSCALRGSLEAVWMHTQEAVDRFLAAKQPTWRKATYTNRRYHLNHFAVACPDLPTDPEPIEAFLATIPGLLYRYHHWCSIRYLYTWSARRLKVNENPCPLVEAPVKPKTEPYFLEEEDLRRLLLHPKHTVRNRTVLWLLADTGMRIGEAHSMTVEGMHDGWVHVDGKTGPRWVPVHPTVMRMLRDIAPDGGPFWLGKRGPLSKNGLQMAVRVAFMHAGFIGEKMSPHRLRHTFATLWTGTDSDGMDAGGWKTYKTWRDYKHLRPPRLLAAHTTHSPIEQLALF